MGSQTLEILRQGVWASLTGGWFYDPHQNLFCNTVHLYIWLFLLCLPFSVYLYFPSATVLGWTIYCGLVAIVFTLLKLLNHGLHHLYDTSECVLIPNSSTQPSNDNTQREEGMELQTLRASSGGATQGSDNESVTSLEYHKPNNSTIDLKVDVHRKNSSESSVDGHITSSNKHEEPPIGTKIDLTLSLVDEGSSYSKPPSNRHPAKGVYCHRKDYRIIKGKRYHGYKLDKHTEHYRSRRRFNNEDALHQPHRCLDSDWNTVHLQSGRQNEPIEWEYLRERDRPRAQSKLRQQLSLESRDNSDLAWAGPASPKKKLAHRRRYANYPDESCTKSTMALTGAQCSNMRRNFNSTMSTIQLPLLNSTAQLVSHMRRHSHNTDAGFFASVELGAYMLENNETPPKESDLKNKGISSGVRRIKSAALEIGCPPPSVSNLSPHPNSVESIGGQVLKNPKNSVIPPPSKCLTRGPHLNLYPKNEAGEGCSYPYLNYGSEIVYPIAEISDEMQTSQKETDLDSSGDSYSDYDDEHANMKHQFRGFDWDADQSPTARSSDSDYENNGSRSPLLDHGAPTCVIRPKNQTVCKKHCCCNRHLGKTSLESYPIANKSKSSRLKKPVRHETHFLSEVKFINETNKVDTRKQISEIHKTEKLEPPEVDNSRKVVVAVDKFDKTSANSKDLLIEKSSLESNENPVKGSNENSNETKFWDHEINNVSSSTESNENRFDANNINNKAETEESHLTCDSKSADEKSLYSIEWLFEEPKNSEQSSRETDPNVSEGATCSKVLGEATNVPKSLGAIPKQIKNITRSRASSQKENKIRESRRQSDENEELIYLDAVEAQAALVQGLECLFAATNANTVVMPQPNRDERSKNQRQHSLRGEREQQKTRKRSIEEVAQTSTSALLPTSMPLLAAFLNSRVDFPNIPVCVADAGSAQSEPRTSIDEGQRARIMDRNHRNRVRKIKRSTRQRNQAFLNTSEKRKESVSNGESPSDGNAAHYATSFEDTTDGAIHCFMDEYGNWMSYSFDKNVDTRETQARIVHKEDTRVVSARPRENVGHFMARMDQEGSSGSLESEAGNVAESAIIKRGDSVDQSSSNQGSNNPLIASNTNLSNVNHSSASKRFYVFDVPPCTSQNDQPRSPVAYVTDSLLERIEAERQSRMGFPSMHINFLMNQQRQQQLQQQQQQQQQTQTDPTPEVTPPTAVPGLMPSIGEEYTTRDTALRNRLSKLIDSMEKAVPRKPKSYYKIKLFNCWDIKVTMDRLKLMALFDRNLTIKDTLISIVLAIMVSVLGSIALNLGFYKDVYAFWFCFIMAGSQYSLLKSVQPDSSSPVHGFNKMVVFSRPVYFCLCTAILCGIHNYLEQSDGNEADDSYGRLRRSIETSSPTTVYGFEVNETDILLIIQWVLSKFLLFFPLAFSLGFFPQVNTFLMYLLEQIDMHVFGGNATSSLSAALFCIVRSVAAVGVVYGFAYSGLIEGNKSQHKKHNILLSIFCGILVPMSYHLSRSASDYTLIWNLIKKHLLPPELYVIHNPDAVAEPEKGDPATLSETSIKGSKKNNSESNISKQHSIGSSASKINFSSETNISKSQKRSQTSSVSSLKFDARDLNSNSSLKGEGPTEPEDKSSSNAPGAKQDTTNGDKVEEDMEDPLPKKLQATVNARLKNDVIVCTFLALLVFGLHCTTVFSTLSPQLNTVLWIIAGVLGWILHYIWPQLRKQQPWLCVAGPILRSHEHGLFEVSEPAILMWFEKIYVYLSFLERNIIYPAIVVAATTQDAPAIAAKYGDALGALIISVCALKCLRNAYSETASQYLIIIFAVLIFQKDFTNLKLSETFLVDYFITAIIFNKVYEFLLKIQFVVTYIAPWQITWGSAFHAFAQPFSVPHSAMLFLQAALSALISSPLTPVLGSAIFMTSYVRPIKFWERDYNTKRVDQSNTRLSSQLERNLGADDNNLNSIFYEHLTRSLQHFLCGDLMLGRWGQVQQGDCFVLASDYLNCLVHIVELGNGLVSFQLRGLEFRGTYCQQREVEAISEGPEENNEGVLNTWTGLSRLLTPSTCWALRWLAWQLAASKYVLQGYSVSDNSATSMLQVFEFRKVILTYYVKSIIYYTIQSNKLEEWLASPLLVEALKPISERNFVDLDPIFNSNLDEDYDFRASGITRCRFFGVYHEWISYCGARRDVSSRRRAVGRDSPLVTLVFALSLVGRRALAAAQHLPASSVEFFLHGLHSLFKGDFRITCARDEWVFTDMALLHAVLAPAVRMALKLHQDHFMFPEEYSSCTALYTAISNHSVRLVICHEAAPAWRHNVLRGAPHLLALRHVVDEGNDDYKIIMLNKRHLGFRVIKLNRECVRGLWAGQQQELVYLRNRNPERGSIQNAKQVLRNIINSSCDQPIGYPIYVSPLTTSYSDTSEQLCSLVGGAVSVTAIRNLVIAAWRRVRRRCGEGCSSGGGAGVPAAGAGARAPPPQQLHLSRTSLAGTRGSLASAGKPTSSTLASLAGLLREHSHERTHEDGGQASAVESSETRRRSDDRLNVDRITLRRHGRRRPTLRQQYEARRARSSDDDDSDEANPRRPRYPLSEKAKALSKPSKEIRHERESYRELTGKYTELPIEGAMANKDSAKYSDLSAKESSIRIERKGKEVKTKIKRSDSGRSELKMNVSLGSKVIIMDPSGVYDCINLGRRIDVQWPSELQRERGGRTFWGNWVPLAAMDGLVVHKWTPNHSNPKLRSHVDKTILLVQIGDKFVPIAENCVQDLGDEV